MPGPPPRPDHDRGPAPSAGGPPSAETLQRLRPPPSTFVVPSGGRRLIRAVTFGLLTPGAAAAMELEHALVRRVRTRQTEPQTVAFVGSKGGVGTTTTAIGAAVALAVLRNDATVLVDGRTGTASLAARLTGAPAPTTADLTRADDQRKPLAHGTTGLHLVDGAPWSAPLDQSATSRLLRDFRRDFQFIGLDLGDHASETVPPMLRHVDRLIVVTAVSGDALEATRLVLQRISQMDPRLTTTVTIAAVCLSSRSHRTLTRDLRRGLDLESSRIIPVPHDPALASGGGIDVDRLRSSTREAYLRLAAMMADPGGTAQRPRVAGRRPPALPPAAAAPSPVAAPVSASGPAPGPAPGAHPPPQG